MYYRENNNTMTETHFTDIPPITMDEVVVDALRHHEYHNGDNSQIMVMNQQSYDDLIKEDKIDIIAGERTCHTLQVAIDSDLKYEQFKIY